MVAILRGRVRQGAQVMLHDLAQDARRLKPLVVQVAQPVESCHFAGDRVHAVGPLKLPGKFLGQRIARGAHEGLQPAACAVVEVHPGSIRQRHVELGECHLHSKF
jgi:hypothetical protein